MDGRKLRETTVSEHGKEKTGLEGFRLRLHEIIFEADTPAGKIFDIALIICILASVAVVMLDSVPAYRETHGALLATLEWIFTALFTIEYGLRLYCVGKPSKYAASFYGVVDLAAVLPTYLSFILPAGRFLRVIRLLRVCRIFRVLKLSTYLGEADLLIRSIKASRRRILVFVVSIVAIVCILGAVMHVVEDPKRVPDSQFHSIPHGVYWAIVTMTTVGYGDISPQTPVGRGIASIVMLLGYSIIAIPTGIVTAEAIADHKLRKRISTQACPDCSAEGHDVDAAYCKYCGHKL